MEFALRTILKDMEELHEKGVRLVWLGSEERVSAKLRDALRRVETLTANNTRGTLGLCLNYGGQREIVDAVRDIVREGAQPEDVTEEMVARHLYGPPDVPPIDLLIRTSGERRISNFMLWRAAYSELKFEIGRASCRERVCQYV